MPHTATHTNTAARALASRLRAARHATAMTQADVARALSLSRATVAQIELGNRAVTSLELARFSRLYERDLRHFLADAFETEDALTTIFRDDADAPFRDALRSIVTLAVELTTLSRRLDIDPPSLPAPLPVPASRAQAIRQGERTADEERTRLDIGTHPLTDLVALLQARAVFVARVALPAGVTTAALADPRIGGVLAIDAALSPDRQLFSLAHAYAHHLLDRDRRRTLCHPRARDTPLELRANAFASAFLMPAAAVHRFLASCGKGHPSRSRTAVFDGDTATAVELRSTPHTQDVTLHDVVRLSHYFRLSPEAAIHRLGNLDLITTPEREALLAEASRHAAALHTALAIPRGGALDTPTSLLQRTIALALESYRRGIVTRKKLRELAANVGVPADRVLLLLRV